MVLFFKRLFAVGTALTLSFVSAQVNVIRMSLKRVDSSYETFRYAGKLENPIQDESTLGAIETAMRSEEGSHTVKVLVGGQPRELIIDTGSGKTAFICETCHVCGTAHDNPPYHFTKNASYVSCHSSQDLDAHQCEECEDNKCKYKQQYVEGDYWLAYKAQDHFGFTEDLDFSTPVEFGCIYEQSGMFSTQSSDGIMGLSRHPDSIYEQFYRSGAIKNRIFSQCLSSSGGSLVFGGVDLALNTTPLIYTPVRNYGHQYWSVFLESIDVNGDVLSVDSDIYNDNRGCVLDSGTTFVYLPSAVKKAFQNSWHRIIGERNHPPFPIHTTQNFHLSMEEFEALPTICFNLKNLAKICMKAEQYLYEITKHHYTGTFFFEDNVKSLIIGASALANHNIVYDADNSRVGIALADCDRSMTSSSSQKNRLLELSINPGGETFASTFDYHYFGQVLIASICFFAVLMTLNVVLQRFVEEKEKGKEEEEEYGFMLYTE
jgi:hypothetical protein